MTVTEHAQGEGGYRAAVSREYARLPLQCCALSLQPFTTPVCVASASLGGHVHIFDLLSIVPWVRAHGTHPVTSEPLTTKELVKLKFHRNEEGAFACPATGKQFSAHTRVVALRPTGNVFSWDAVDSLCLARKHLKDLLDDTPFSRADILVLQDSANAEWVAAHRSGAAKARGAAGGGGGGGGGGGAAAAAGGARSEMANSGGGTIRLSEATRAILAEMPAAAAGGGGGGGGGGSGGGGAHVAGFGVATSGRYSGSATSTAITTVTRNEAAAPTAADADAARWARLAAAGQKALVRLVTSLGALNFELHCDLAPRTCENFLLLAGRGYYDSTPFHRVIRNFMAQGGDPTGTGRGGKSAWGAAFKDEFHPKLSHDGRGVLSMANSGADSNGSQFFVTFKSCAHLDRKHSVFGRLVGGEEALRAMELLPVGADDRPKAPGCSLLRVEVFKNPLELLKAPPAAAAAAAAAGVAAAAAAAAKRGREGAGSAALPPPRAAPGGGADAAAPEAPAVGKYMRAPAAPAAALDESAAKRARAAGGGGGGGGGGDALAAADFSSW